MKDNENQFASEWAESHFPLYIAKSIHSLYSTSTVPTYEIDEGFAVLLAIAGGKGKLRTEEQVYELAEGSVVLLPARCGAALIADLAQPLHAYKLVIGTEEQRGAQEAGVMTRKSEIASASSVQFFPYEPAIAAQVEELYAHRSPAGEARHVRNQMVFHHIILQLLERQEAKGAAGEQPSMERSIAYMENRYSDKITSEQLAVMAGVSRSHYSILFKQLTGFSPNEYLSRLRVHRAKELLIGGSGTLREIAQKVGYKDEFYLSRRFKQQTGAPPSGYNREPFRRVAVWLAPYASHLLLLGLEPAITIAESGEYVNAADLEPPRSMMFIDTGCSAEQVKSALLDAGIELIIAARQHLQQYGLTPEQLRAAAPIIEVPWMEMGWKEHLRLIAKAVQRSERAERWLAAFEKEEQAARLEVRQSAMSDEVITILVIKPEELLVYGARNVGYVIYQSLGLRPPAPIGEEIRKRGDQFHSLSIQISELEDYAGDRLLIVVFPDGRGSTAHSETIFKSLYWKKLPVVQRNRVHMLELDDWVPYNPVSIRLQLRRAVALLTGKQ